VSIQIIIETKKKKMRKFKLYFLDLHAVILFINVLLSLSRRMQTEYFENRTRFSYFKLLAFLNSTLTIQFITIVRRYVQLK